MGNPVLRYLKRDLAGFRKRPKAGVQVGMPKVPVNPDHLEYLIKDYESIESQLAEAVALLEGGDHCYNGGIPLGDWYRRYDKLLEQVK